MENMFRCLCGAAAGAIGFFAPVHSLIVCAVVFVGIDFLTGIIASRKRAVREKRKWGIESRRAWNTVYKLLFVMAGIVLAWLIDFYVLDFMSLRLANLFTGFVCGVEFWSYLENAADISEHPVFKWLKKYMRQRVDKALENEG